MADTGKVVALPRRLANKAHSKQPGSEVDKNQQIAPDSPFLVSQSVRQLRLNGRTQEAIRKLAKEDGTVSAAVFAMVQVAMSGFNVKAYNTGDNLHSIEGTELARSIIASMDTLYDYTKGYADKKPINAVLESGIREVILTGAIAGELVLDKQRLPDRIQLVAHETIRWYSNGDEGKYPKQQPSGGGDEIDLNIATFWVAEMHKEATQKYVGSMLEAALNSSFYYTEFIEDMRRTVRRGGHSRLIAKLNTEMVVAAAPQDIQDDPVKLKTFLDDVRTGVEDIISKLEPEDAVVSFDSVEFDNLTADGEKADYKELLNALSGVLATSLKSHPSILGLRLSGSQSLSNTESLIFLKTARAAQVPVETFMSRALTLAARLYGADVYVKFRFTPIDIRPETELEAFKTMEQARILEQLSLGFITDEEAAELLHTGPRAPGAPKLSGTMFTKNTSADKAENASPNADPQGRALQPDTPKKGGGESQ